MIAIRKYVLVEQKFTKKENSNIIIPGQEENKDLTYEISLTVKQLGQECPKEELFVGDKIIVNEYAKPQKIDNIKGSFDKADKEIINEAIYSYEDIVGKE